METNKTEAGKLFTITFYLIGKKEKKDYRALDLAAALEAFHNDQAIKGAIFSEIDDHAY